MQTLFSTKGKKTGDKFRFWRETTYAAVGPFDLTRICDGPFDAVTEAAEIGPLQVFRTSRGAHRMEFTPASIRRVESRGMLAVSIQPSGFYEIEQDGRQGVHRAGDILVSDHRPTVGVTRGGGGSLMLKVPRERLERMLGSARLYSALSIGSEQASTRLATTFFNELVRVHEQLDPDAAARMASVGIDLIVASIAERLAKDVPKPRHGTVVVQRAKAYVESNLGDPTLDPPQLAAAVGVSLRRLQELFQEHGRHISDWIWQRRLETAAGRLADRGYAHLLIGIIAYGCGFVSQAHFARRFKDRYGMSPNEYRQMKINKVADDYERRTISRSIEMQ